MKISAVLIVKNEEDIVANALESVKGFDEIVVVDTGSTDSTVEIASKYTDRVFHFPWIDDFSAARNHAIKHATGDWIYSIDADHELVTDAETVRSEVEKADKLGHKTVLVETAGGKGDHKGRWRCVLFKNDPDVRWHGHIHENIKPAATYKANVSRIVGYSDNHKKDPMRNIRLLEKGPITLRSKFYLGREYYERRVYDKAIFWMKEYLKDGTWIAETGEAWLTLARSYWFTNQGNKAREACLMAIRDNPDFKEALLFMSSIHSEPWKTKWNRLAQASNNDDVLFKRT